MEKSTKILIIAWVCSFPFSVFIGAIFPFNEIQGFLELYLKFIVVLWVSATYVFVTLELMKKADGENSDTSDIERCV